MAKASTAKATIDIEDSEQRLQSLKTRRAELDKELDAIEEQVSTNQGLSRDLKKRLAAGDRTASAALDRVDAELKELTRIGDGKRFSIQEVDAEIGPIERQLDEERRVRSAEERKQERARQFKEASERLEALGQRFKALHTEACKTLGELRLAAHDVIQRFSPEGGHHLVERVVKPLANPVVALENAGWREPFVPIYPKNFEIRGLVPPAGYRSNKI